MPSALFPTAAAAALSDRDLATIAIAAAAVALLACLVLVFLLVRVRRDQRVVLGGGDRGDLITAVAELSRRVDASDRRGESIAGELTAAERALTERLGGCVAHTAVIRYDAYGEMSGRQSSTVALLDSAGTGVVISSILHREQARMYAKPVRDGSGEIELSPEEQEAVETAMGGGA